MAILKRINWYLFCALVVYNILDAWHTKLLLATGLIIEANPIMDYFITNFGVNSLFYIKIISLIILACFLCILHRKVKVAY